MKILITGANGYLGRGVTKSLLAEGYSIIATDINDFDIDSKIEKKICNIFELDNPYEYFNRPDILIHFAWRDGFIHDSMNHFIDLPKHYLFIKKLIDGGVNEILALGSMHEVGFYEGSINENTPTNPQSLYGISKNALRKAIELECMKNNIAFKWLRGFYIVGDDIRGCSIFSKIALAEINGEKEFPFTLGLNQFDFLDYDVFVRQVINVIKQNEIHGIINICSGRPEKLADRVEKFIDTNGFKIKLKYGVFPDRPYDSKAIWGDNKKIIEIEKIIEKHKEVKG